MGFLGRLKFVLLCFDFLAWPVFALGYPLCASIRAIETGSKDHMRKLVIYWTLFSLMSLFEFAFVKIIEWIPYWSCIKLVFICWLVVPQFRGACYVYDSLLHPCLSLNLQAVMSKLYKTIEDKPVKTDFFLDVAEEYIKQNGSEALEKLIASKLECMKTDSSPTGKQVKKLDQKNAGATLKQVTTEEIKVMLQPTGQSAMKPNVTKLENPAHRTEKKSEASAADIKEMTPSEATAGMSSCPEAVSLKQVQREWTCALCLVTTTSEKTLNAHFQGSRHKANCEQSKTSKNSTPKGTGSSPLKDKPNKAKPEVVKKPAGEGLLPKPVKAQGTNNHQKSAVPKPDGAAGPAVKLICKVCDVKLLSDVDMQSHIKGKKHLANIEQLMKTGTGRTAQ